ncbi:MAG TPA: winged helix-turn-helix domain-containing protein [Kofleriaceae bacterium]|nr:winged helix-turn-helix domain-containing protein [Kofleriaceae bacterium]
MIELSDLTIDINEKTVRRGADRIPLTPLEYRLFEYLAVRAGEIVSREDIARTLGGRSEAMRSNMIDVYIGYLRRKLGTTTIATKRGKGYLVTRRDASQPHEAAATAGQ